MKKKPNLPFCHCRLRGLYYTRLAPRAATACVASTARGCLRVRPPLDATASTLDQPVICLGRWQRHRLPLHRFIIGPVYLKARAEGLG
ncbi:hypothetical protein BHE74_00015678 [Ensete ventricosum]|nr:hypothetical protein BHE74_00015678 [Ensete ventricosum]